MNGVAGEYFVPHYWTLRVCCAFLDVNSRPSTIFPQDIPTRSLVCSGCGSVKKTASHPTGQPSRPSTWKPRKRCVRIRWVATMISLGLSKSTPIKLLRSKAFSFEAFSLIFPTRVPHRFFVTNRDSRVTFAQPLLTFTMFAFLIES